MTVSPDWYTIPFKDDSGTATGGGNTTLTDTNKTWTLNEWATGEVMITGGTGSGQERIVDSNDTTTITVAPAWDTNPDTSSQYTVRHGSEYELTLGPRIHLWSDWYDTPPCRRDKYVLVERTRRWHYRGYVPAVVTVWEALTNPCDLGYPGPADEDLPGDCAAIYRTIWGANRMLTALSTGLGGIPDDKIDSVAALFVAKPGPSRADAFVPGMVNLLSVVSTTNTAAVAKPFGPRNSSGDDVFEDEMDDLLSGVIEGEYIDDWDTYHVNAGEVHCGTNSKRKLPTDKRWWDEW